VEWGSGVVVALMSDRGANDQFFAVNWDINSIVIDDGLFLSWLPVGPV